MIDEDHLASRLPSMLTDVPMPPSTVDLAQAIKTGRRRRSVRYVASGVAALAVIAAVPIALQSQRPQAPPLALPPSSSPSPVAAAAPTTCAVAQVAEGFLTLNSDPTGRHFAGTFSASSPETANDPSTHKPAVWKDGRVQMIPVPDGTAGYVDAVNASGVVIGRLVGKTGVFTFAYQDGKLHVLPDSQGSRVIAINGAGVIVGARSTADAWIPVRWRSPVSAPESLPLPAGYHSGVAMTVRDDGVMFGTVGKKELSPRDTISYMWTADGTGSAPPMPAGFTVGIASGSGDWVNGQIPPKDQNSKPTVFVLNMRTQELRQFPGFDLEGETSVSSTAWFIGQVRDGQERRVLTDGTTSITLPRPEGVTRVLLDSVSADARVVTGHRTDDKRAGVIWRCS